MTSAPPRHSPMARLASTYWVDSSRPLASLVFVTPLLIIYEMGVLVLGPQAVRNGADVWLRQLLEWVGFGQYFLLPVLTVSILLGWHYTTRQPWRLSSSILYGMISECVLLAICLWLLLQLQGSLFHSLMGAGDQAPPQVVVALSISGKIRGGIGFLGAGVYEELLFRLILLSLVGWVLRRLGTGRGLSIVAAVLLTSLTFAVAHYVGPYGESWQWASSSFWFSFLFRFLAGVFFSVLFVQRGFGIAAGTHAGYDILVGLF